MKKWIALFFILTPTMLFAAGSNMPLEAANNDVSDKISLQRGATLFMNYCFGCHSTQYQRYQRVATDLAIPDDLMIENLVFNPNAKIGDLIKNATSPEQSAALFGVPAPDLTLVARVRGVDWLYTYLRAFYQDDSRPFGVNNLLFPSVGMPHVLESLQGTPIKTVDDIYEDGELVEQVVQITSLGNGEMSAGEYDDAVRDLVNFLDYSAEPMQLERQRMGYWVIGFFIIFLILAILLKKEYWRDVK